MALHKNQKTTGGRKGRKKPHEKALTGAAGSPKGHNELEQKLDELSETNRRMKRKIFDLYTIFEISRNFSAVLDYKTLLDSFIFTCLGQVGVLRGAIFLKDSIDSQAFRMAMAKGSGILPDAHAAFEDDSLLTRYLTRLNRPVFIDDLSADIVTPEEVRILDLFRGGVLVPLIYKTRLAGLFVLADKISSRSFNSDEIEFISALGNQISVAIENARLYEAEKAANEQLWTAQQQLIQAERRAALGEMSAKIAHEVNNPLGIIKNYLLLLKRSKSDNNKVGEYVDVINQEIDRIANIVDELRQFQRQDRIEFSAVDMRDVLNTTLTLAARQLSGRGIELVRDFVDGEFWVKGNADHLRQVFLNLILNARAAMEAGGTLTVKLGRDLGKVRVRFLDTGPGIPEKIVPNIFEPFFTTKGGDGSGLGLSICDGIMKSHKGSISFKNVAGGGCFEIYLPLLKKP